MEDKRNHDNKNNNKNRFTIPLESLYDIFKAANTRQENGYGEYTRISSMRIRFLYPHSVSGYIKYMTLINRYRRIFVSKSQYLLPHIWPVISKVVIFMIYHIFS